jgi:hypothetical protein
MHYFGVTNEVQICFYLFVERSRNVVVLGGNAIIYVLSRPWGGWRNEIVAAADDALRSLSFLHICTPPKGYSSCALRDVGFKRHNFAFGGGCRSTPTLPNIEVRMCLSINRVE